MKRLSGHSEGSFGGDAEKGKMDGSVDAYFAETGMIGEVVRAGVLKNEASAGSQQASAKHGLGQFRQAGKGVGGIGENEVEGGRGCGTEVAEGIAANEVKGARWRSESARHVGNEGGMCAIGFYSGDGSATARKEFKSDAARAGKEIQGTGLVQRDKVFEHVEEILLGKIRRRSGIEGGGHLEAQAAISSSYDSHSIFGL